MTKLRNDGFTIIELTVATAIFSLVFLLASAGILYIARLYYRGVSQVRVQDAARTVADEIGETLRYSTGLFANPLTVTGPDIPANNPAHVGAFCIGSQRYMYAIDRKVTDAGSNDANKEKRHGLWIDQPASCSDETALLDNDTPTPSGRELLGEDMRLTRLEVIQLPITGAYQVNVGVAYGDEDLLETDGAYKKCKVGPGSEFCATSNVSVTINRRF